MIMYKKTFLLFLAITFSGCASMGDPSLSEGVKRQGGGVYSVSELGMLCLFGCDLTEAAAKQCQLDGNKKLVILGSTATVGFSGTRYPQLIFRCN
jgi:hypothetical protein